jgi:AcrR family transcriptional regulator
MASPGRPRSESARVAVIHAVDDLLVEQGYAAMSMKSIAERAGVSRQTLYRWWSTKAEVLFEASHVDSRKALALPVDGTPQERLTAFLIRAVDFLFDNPAGVTWRVLVGEAQHDAEVAGLVRGRDPFATPTAEALRELGLLGDNGDDGEDGRDDADAKHLVIGPVLAAALLGDRAETSAVAHAVAERTIRLSALG